MSTADLFELKIYFLSITTVWWCHVNMLHMFDPSSTTWKKGVKTMLKPQKSGHGMSKVERGKNLFNYSNIKSLFVWATVWWNDNEAKNYMSFTAYTVDLKSWEQQHLMTLSTTMGSSRSKSSLNKCFNYSLRAQNIQNFFFLYKRN